MKRKPTQRQVLRRQTELLRRISGRRVKYTRTRATLYEFKRGWKKPRYVGYVKKTEFRTLMKRAQGTISLGVKSKGLRRVTMRPVVLEQKARIRGESKKIKIFTYTRQQREYVAASIRARKLPVSGRLTGALRRVLDLRKELLGSFIRVSKWLKGSP